MPYFIRKEGDKECVVKGDKANPGETVKCHATHAEAVAHLRALYVNVEDAGKAATSEPASDEEPESDCVCPNGHKIETDEETPCPTTCPQCGAKMGGAEAKNLGELTVYKAGNKWRWLTVSNVAVEDKEHEIVSEQAYDDAIAYAYKNNDFGELDLVHVEGTDAGPGDLMLRLGKRLIEGGEWFDDNRSTRNRVKVQAKPDYWGVSIKFKYDPEQFDGKVYKGGIRILKRTILPRHMAASYGTAIAVHGGAQMKRIDEETIAALKELDMTDDEIAALVEKQKALPSEENVKIKEEETEVKIEPEMVEIKAPINFWDSIKGAVQEVVDSFKKTPEPEKLTTDVSENSDAEPEVESEKEVAQEPVAPVEEKQFVTTEVLQAYGTQLAQTIVAAIAKEVADLKLEQEKAKDWRTATEKKLVELAKPVEQRIMDRLAELPPIVKTRVSHLDVTAKGDGSQPRKTLPQQLMDDINSEIGRVRTSDKIEV